MATFRNPFDRRQQVDPEDERDFWSSLASTASPLLSGLSSVGFGIEKYGGGRALKGTLAGKPRELLSIIPFSDQMGLTQASDRTGGAELLNRWGLTSQRDPSLFSGEGAAGLAADIVFDPLNALFLGGGAVTNLGKAIGKAGVSLKGGAARAAGLAQGSDELAKAAKYLSSTPEAASGVRGFFGMPESQVAANIAGKKLGGNIGVGLPFGLSDRATAVIPWAGIGNAATKIPLAGPVLGGVGKGLQTAGRLGSAAFEKATKGRVGELGQTIARSQSEAEAGARALGLQELHKVMEANPGVNWADEPTNAALREMVENPNVPRTGVLGKAAGDIDNALAAERSIAGEYRPAGLLQDDFRNIGYAPRRASDEYATPGFLKPMLKPELEKSRIEALKAGLTTQQYNDFLKTPMGNKTPGALASDIRQNYQKWTPTEVAEFNTLKNAATPLNAQQAARLNVLETAWGSADKLASFKAHLGDVQYDLFDKPFLTDLAAKFTKTYANNATSAKLHEGLLAASLPATQASADTVTVWKTMQDAGLTVQQGAAPLQRTVQTLERMLGRPVTNQEALKELATRVISKTDYNDIVGTVSTFTSPTWLKQTLDVVDSATNMFRGLVTQIWPSYLARNFASNVAHGVIYKGFDPTATGAMRYLKPLADARTWQKGGVIADAHMIPEFAGMSAKEASDELGRRIIQWDIAGKGQFEHMANLPKQEVLRDLIPGLPRQGWKEVAENFKGKKPLDYINPFGVKGVGGNKVDVNPLVGAGRDVSTMTDAMNRVALFIAKKRQGFSDEAARLDVLKAYYDFGNLSGFETAAMRRMMPFYGWSRQSIPTIIKDVFENPGGRMATVLKTLSKARGSKEGFLPEHLGDKIALPIGEEKDGTQRYLSQLGLPVEEVGQIAANPMQYALGQLNPFVKGPLELATNRQFFSGRELSDLRSSAGAPVGIENILANSPLARGITTARTIADPRKGALAKALNLLTSVKITDVDMDRARTAAGRRALEEQLRSLPNVRQTPGRPYIPRSLRANATDEEKALLALYGSLRGQ